MSSDQIQWAMRTMPIWGWIFSAFLFSGCLSSVRAVPTPTPWPTPVLTEKESYIVQRGTMIDQFELTGKVVPVKWEPLAFKMDGELASLSVQEGDVVEENHLVATLAMPDLLEALEQAQLELEQAQDALSLHDRQFNFDLKRAQLELQKAELLLEQAQATEDDAATALQEVEVALAQLTVEEIEADIDPTLARNVTKAELSVKALERQIEERRIRAPFDGEIIAIGIGLDDVRSFTEPPQPRTPIPAYSPFILIAEPDAIAVIVDGGEPRANELEVGQIVSATHRWSRDKPFELEVTTLPRVLESQGFRPEFPEAVHFAFPGTMPEIASGDQVKITVVSSVYEDTLILPDVTVRRFAGRTFVVQQDGDKQRRIDVEIGLEHDDQVEILAGLSEGDIVIGR